MILIYLIHSTGSSGTDPCDSHSCVTSSAFENTSVSHQKDIPILCCLSFLPDRTEEGIKKVGRQQLTLCAGLMMIIVLGQAARIHVSLFVDLLALWWSKVKTGHIQLVYTFLLGSSFVHMLLLCRQL